MPVKTKNVYTYENGNLRPSGRQTTTNTFPPDQTLYTVGTNGDFINLNDCFNYLRNFDVSKESIEVRMLSGFYIEEQLEFHGDNFNRITLTSVDEEVLLSREYALATNTGSDINPFVNARNSTIFSLGTQIRMDNTGTPSGDDMQNHNSGVNLSEQSSFTILSSNIAGKPCGLSNFMSHGVILINNSSLVVDFQSFINGTGTGGDFSFSSAASVWASNIVAFMGSNVIVSGGNVMDAINSNLRIDNGSQAYIQQSNCVGAGQHGLYVGVGARASGGLTDFRKDGETNSSSDIFIEKGGIAQIDGANGGCNLTANTVTSDGLFIN